MSDINNMQEKINWHWRNSMRPVRFFGFDARAGFPIFLLIIYPRLTTIGLAILSFILFSILEKFGLTFEAATRRFRSLIIGHHRPAHNHFGKRKLKDFG